MHEKGLLQVVMFIGVGIGIAFGIEVTIGGYFETDSDSDPDTDSDPGISRYHLYFPDRNHLGAKRLPRASA